MNCGATILRILRQRPDIRHILLAEKVEPGEVVIDFVGGPDFFDEECIFDSCDDATVRSLLMDFIQHRPGLGWAVNRELMKLLATKGTLVAEEIEPIILAPVSESFAPRFMFFSYFACMPGGDEHCLRLLDLLPEDSRDGLFLACYRLNTVPLYEKLVLKFREWMADGEWGLSSGERHLLSQFIERWDTLFPNGLHSCLIR